MFYCHAGRIVFGIEDICLFVLSGRCAVDVLSLFPVAVLSPCEADWSRDVLGLCGVGLQLKCCCHAGRMHCTCSVAMRGVFAVDFLFSCGMRLQ